MYISKLAIDVFCQEAIVKYFYHGNLKIEDTQQFTLMCELTN